MFELPEVITIARQMNETLAGNTVRDGRLGNVPHKFVWYNRTPEEFTRLATGTEVGQAWAEGKSLFVPLRPGYILLLAEWGGRVLYHRPGAAPPASYHLLIDFVDGSHLSATTRLWGAAELWEEGRERERPAAKEMRIAPTDPAFTPEYLRELIELALTDGQRSVKSLLTQDQLIPGLGNAIAQDIMFRARLHPRHLLGDLNADEVLGLHQAIAVTVRNAVAAGGRCDERDLFDRPGGYVRMMDAKAAGHPCPDCGAAIEKFKYLGGTCVICPTCQR